MLTLRELQLQFAAALFDGADAAVVPHIVANGIDPAQRIDIYRNNLHEGFIQALALAFPVIERLVGTDYFRQLARDFQRAHPSRAGDLHHIGKPFEGFLRARFAETQYAYLPDVAALEWAVEEALIAPDAQPLDPNAFREIDPADYEDLRFELHPASRLVQSPYPIVRIWQANQPGAESDELIDLDAGGARALVLRTTDGIELHDVPAGDFALLEAFARGAPLGLALDEAQRAEPDFDLGAALVRFMKMKLIVGLAKQGP
ncbi:MAG TPA: DNA-binding domain-containing protein [Steroidobacteraceae bacterium]|nr:DNA-binding domain-containing protein [Steroidobacteraceae bacterium]